MKVKALKRFYHDKLGRVSPGDIVELQEAQATMFLEQRAVERYATKVVREIPLPDAGVTTQSSALPAAQASQPTTSEKPKRGRKPKATVL
jgi:hypothetical protein